MALFNFAKKSEEETPVSPEMESFLKGYSIEVMPRTAEKVEDFRALLPKGTRVYIAPLMSPGRSARTGLYSSLTFSGVSAKVRSSMSFVLSVNLMTPRLGTNVVNG